MTEVQPRWKTSHVRSCSKPMCSDNRPCNSCRGKANQANGRKAQRRAARKLGIRPRFAGHLGNEESWRHVFRLECKSGAQVGPIFLRYIVAESQSTASKAHGDARPFAMVAMPDDAEDGLVLMRLSTFRREIAPLLEP